MVLFYRRFLKISGVLVLFAFITLTPANGQGVTGGRENAVVRAVRDVGPAVVNISSEYELSQKTNPFFNFGLDPFF